MVAYREIANQLRILLCDTKDRRPNALLPKLFPHVKLHPLSSQPKKELLEIDGKKLGFFISGPLIEENGVVRLPELFNLKADPIPMDDWLNLCIISPEITLRDLIKSVAEKNGGSHIDEIINETVIKGEFLHLKGIECKIIYITEIGRFILSEVRILLGEKSRNTSHKKEEDFQNTTMTKQDGIDREMNRIYDIINEGKYDEALREFNAIEAKNPKNYAVKYNRVGFLIDIGFGLRNPRMIKRGVFWGERILKHLKKDDHKGHLCYNIGNGYMSLFQLKYGKMVPEEFVGNRYLQYSKCCYREAIKRERYLKSGTKKQLYTNFGNCLDSLGRVMEALYAYDEALKIEPEFPMALGNKAKAMQFFADISGAYRKGIYIKSYQLYKSALDNEEELIKYGGISARVGFENRKLQIEGLFKDKKVLTKKIRHRKYKISSMTEFERFYVEFCSKHKLYLNFHIHEDDCEASIVDPIFISMISPISDNETFFNLAKYINQIKEDYLVARLLLVQSQYKKEDFNRISKRMTFANTQDYSTFNVYIGLLKCAFKQAYNILDKISRFINEYYRLGCKGDIYFTSIWEIKDNKGLRGARPEILGSKNISLYALYDIYLDFRSKYYRRIQDIRNALIHERLVIYESGMADFDNKEDKNNIGYENMLSETIKLLQMVKSVIIYLVNFVHVEENRKRRDIDGPVGPSFVDTTQIL